MAGGLSVLRAGGDKRRLCLPHRPGRGDHKGRVIGWTVFGSSLPCVVLVIAGTMLVGSDAALGTAIDSDPIGALATILPK